MQHERGDEHDRYVVPYQTVRGPTGGGSLAMISLLCVAVPVLALLARSGPMFLIGLPLSFVGLGFGISAISAAAKTSAVSGIGILATAANGLSVAYFLWLFLIRGLC